MYFPQASHGDHLILGAIAGAAKQLVPKGKTKLGTLVCVEVDTCSRADQLWGENATKFGFQLAYRGKASLAQPDYTGECLAARNQGVQAILMTLDPNSIGRFALSCARQGYRPVFATLAAIQVDRMKDDPNLEGMVVTTPVFPYLQAGTPATDEFQKTMRTYGSKVPVGVGQATGWVAAKLFEKAAANLPEPPSSDAVLRGLWSLRDDTLGDLTLPLSFAENQTAPQQTCWFTLALENHAWVSPDRFKRNCL
jgi:branched-chain amino acid transport system substrate-binding protein